MSEAQSFLASCASQQILVIGDIMVDRYIWGTIDRISPEAPVPVVDVRAEEIRLGGAGNVAINLASMGASVGLIGICGEDDPAQSLIQTLNNHQFDTSGLIFDPGRKTTQKTRILSQGQQVLRVDRESREPVSPPVKQHILNVFQSKLTSANGVIIQDYDKGLLDQELISSIIRQCRSADVPVFVDPKFKNFHHYKGCTVFKPNWREFSQGEGLEPYPLPGLEQIVEVARRLKKKMPHHISLITLGANGVVCVNQSGQAFHLRGKQRQVADVSGAGDSVLSVMTLAYIAGYPPQTAAQFANLAGGIVCEEMGVVPVSKERLTEEINSATESPVTLSV